MSMRSRDDDERDDSFKRVLVLGKVRDIMDLFTLEQPEFDVRQIREGTGLPNSTCVRLLRNMVSDGLLSHEEGRYRIRPGSASLGRCCPAGAGSARDRDAGPEDVA